MKLSSGPAIRPASLLALLAVLAACISGCGATRGSAGAPMILRWSNEGISDIFTLDPAGGPDYNARQPIQLIFGGLVRFGPKFKILPDAAQSWTISGDQRTYTFTLRPNLRFADGSKATATDVAYSLNRALMPAFADRDGAQYFLGDIDGATAVLAGRAKRARGIRVLNSRTIQIHLHAPGGPFLAKLANPTGFIVPRRTVQAHPRTWANHAFGTGPFMVQRWVRNNELLLVPNPNYYAGKPQLTGVAMPFIAEPLTAYKRYRSGALDLMGTIHFPTDVLYDVNRRSDFRQQARLETVYLTLNERRPPFNDTRVRLAFARAVDKNELVRSVFNGLAQPTDGLLPPGLPGFNPHLRGASFNPQLARKLLAQAGYPQGRGLPTVNYPVDQDAQSVVLATALANQWRKELGVKVHLEQHTHSSYLALLDRLDYQIAVIDWTADYPDPQNFLSQQLHTGVPNNNGGWSNARFDQLVDRADSIVGNDKERFKLYQEAEQIAMSDAAIIPLVNPSAGIMIRSQVHGLQITGGRVLVENWAKVTVSGGSSG